VYKTTKKINVLFTAGSASWVGVRWVGTATTRGQTGWVLAQAMACPLVVCGVGYLT
jgi:hypothetical protein